MRALLLGSICYLASSVASVAAFGAGTPVACDDFKQRVNDGMSDAGLEPLQWKFDEAIFGHTTVRIANFSESELVLSCDENGVISLGGGLYERSERSETRWRTFILSMIRAMEPALSLDEAQSVLRSLEEAEQTDTYSDNQQVVPPYRISVSGESASHFLHIDVDPNLGFIYRSAGALDETNLLECQTVNSLVPNEGIIVENRFGHLEERVIKLEQGIQVNLGCTTTGALVLLSVSGAAPDAAWTEILAKAASAVNVRSDLVERLRAEVDRQIKEDPDTFASADEELGAYDLEFYKWEDSDGRLIESFDLTE